MGDWKEYKFSDFVDINPKVALKKGVEYSFVEMKDLSEGKKFVSPSQKRELTGGSRFENGDTLFARITPCLENGKICQVKGLENGVGFGSTEFLVFRGKADVSDTNFVHYLSLSDEVRRFAEQNMVGTSGRQRVSWQAFENIELSLPDLPTQTAIAEILSSLDDKIELNNKINQELENLAQTLFKRWFIDFEFPNENGEPYKSSGGEMIDSELGEIPNGWEVKSLEDITELVRGISYRKHELVSKEEGVPFVNLKCFALDGTFRQDGLKYFNGKFKDSHIIQSNDILVAVTDLTQDRLVIGLPIVWQNEDLALPSLDVCIIRPKETILKDFLLYEFKTHRYKSRIIEFANGSTVLHLSVKGLETYEIGVPSNNLLFQWSEIVNPILKSIGDTIKENQELTNLRDTLLPKLISGELEVSQTQPIA